ncbi:Similarity (fragment) [Microcystis aeruginosa PCC 7941]
MIPKPHDLGFCFFPLRGSAPALTDLLCSGHQVALQTDTASPAAKIFLLALISRSW